MVSYRNHFSYRKRRGLTLIELLVVIAIVGVLMALLLPAIQNARESARRMTCRDNLRQQGYAMHNYESSYGQFPVAALWNVDAVANTIGFGQSWGQVLLPYLDQGSLSNSFDSSQPIWSGTTNQKLIATQLPVYICPSTPLTTPNVTTWNATTATAGGNLNCGIVPSTSITATWGRSDYIVNCDIRSPLRSNLISAGVPASGSYGFFYCGDSNAIAVVTGKGVSGIYDASPSIAKVTDGLSNTIMIAELSARNQLWEKGQNFTTPPSTDTPSAAANFFRLLNQQVNFGGGGWADPQNDQWVDGGNRDGNNDIRDANNDRNSCIINCTNLEGRAFYSFHAGLCHFAMGDGSVRGLSENIDDTVLAFLITRAGGEIAGSY